MFDSRLPPGVSDNDPHFDDDDVRSIRYELVHEPEPGYELTIGNFTSERLDESIEVCKNDDRFLKIIEITIFKDGTYNEQEAYSNF